MLNLSAIGNSVSVNSAGAPSRPQPGTAVYRTQTAQCAAQPGAVPRH